MLALQSKEVRETFIANILPCEVQHDGPIDASRRYWAPTTSSDAKRISYFRGRQLHGKSVKIPEGYRGLVVSSTEKILQPDTAPQDESVPDADQEDTPEVVSVLEEVANFEEMVVWGHEVVPEDANDPYTRSINEWIPFAQQIHTYSSVKQSTGSEQSKTQ